MESPSPAVTGRAPGAARGPRCTVRGSRAVRAAKRCPRCVLLNAVFIKMKNSIQIEMEKDASEWTDAVSVASPCDFTSQSCRRSPPLSPPRSASRSYSHLPLLCSYSFYRRVIATFTIFAHVHMQGEDTRHGSTRDRDGSPTPRCMPSTEARPGHPPSPSLQVYTRHMQIRARASPLTVTRSDRSYTWGCHKRVATCLEETRLEDQAKYSFRIRSPTHGAASSSAAAP